MVKYGQKLEILFLHLLTSNPLLLFTGGIYPGVLSLKSAITAYCRRVPHHMFGKATGGIKSYANSGDVIVLSLCCWA